MARVTYSAGLGFNFGNLPLAITSVTVPDPTLLFFTVAEPLEGFDGFGNVAVHVDDVEARNGKVVSGDVEGIDFSTFTGSHGFQTSIEIEGLEVSLVPFLEALDIVNPLDRLDAVSNLVFGGDDVISAGRNDDFILALGGDDEVSAGAGNDVIAAGSGDDTIDGGSEVVRPFGSIGAIFGGEDTAAGDLVSYSTDTAGVAVDLARGRAVEANGDVDRLIDVEGVSGGLGDDRLAGDGGDNFFITSLGFDRVNGRGGLDVVSYRLDVGVAADLAEGSVLKASGGADRLKDVEGVIGSAGDDTITGDRGDNVLGGGFGGEDVLRGRGGADSFVFSFDQGGTAAIKDFASGEDELVFDRSEFRLTSRFKLVVGDGVDAKGAKSTFIYDVDSRELLIDADGEGGERAQLVAKLSAGTILTIEDFALI
jgi:Ca2+-binding RTX toxin-like protein